MKNLLLFVISVFTSICLSGQEPVLVKDISPGADNGTPYFFKEYDGMIIFSACDTVYNRELWISDGTESGTHLLKEIKPHPIDGSFPGFLTEMNGLLYFDAKEYAQDRILWVTDGTEEGTQKVVDTTALEYIHWEMEVSNNHLFFSGGPGPSNEELWISDGTSDGTYMLKDINPGDDESEPRYLTPYSDKMFFFAMQEGYGVEPWISDGTEDGTLRLKDINPGEGHGIESYTGSGIVYNSMLYFLAFDSIHGTELWVTDGTPNGTQLFKEIVPGPSGGFLWVYPRFTIFDGYLYFVANDTIHGAEIWRSDGTPEGTEIFEDYYPGEDWSSPARFVICNDKLFFFASTPEHGYELRVIENSNSSIQLVKDVVPGPESFYIKNMISYQGNLFFAADDGTNGYELWISDGTSTGTQKSTPQNATKTDPLGDNFYDFGTHNGYVYFSANYDDHGAELYKIGYGSTVIETPLSHFDFNIYPNPAQKNLFLSFNCTNQCEIFVNITSIDGRLVVSKKETTSNAGKQIFNIPLPGEMTSGMYIVEISSKGNSQTLKFIKE